MERLCTIESIQRECIKGECCFTIQKSIGIGGFSSTYNACIKDICNYALKWNSTKRQRETKTQTEMRVEIQYQQRAAEIGISIPIYEIIICDGGYGFIMDKLDITLSDILKEVKNIKEKISILALLIRIVKKLHAANITHNDLHEYNIMRKGDVYYLIDFGEATELDEEKRQTDMCSLIRIFLTKTTSAIIDDLDYKRGYHINIDIIKQNIKDPDDDIILKTFIELLQSIEKDTSDKNIDSILQKYIV